MFGAVLMAATLVTVLAINAASTGTHEHPVFWVTLPAAFIMLCFDLTMGWLNRKETRRIAHEGRRRMETALAEREEARRMSVAQVNVGVMTAQHPQTPGQTLDEKTQPLAEGQSHTETERGHETASSEPASPADEKLETTKKSVPTTLTSLIHDAYTWAQETFPTTMTVFHHLPLPLVPFAFCMFVLVQALVTKGWVPVFAHGWDHWVEKTGTIGAIGGMGFVSVILCNVSFQNKKTTSLRDLKLTYPLRIVCWYKHWHHHPHLPCHSGMGGDSPSERTTHL